MRACSLIFILLLALPPGARAQDAEAGRAPVDGECPLVLIAGFDDGALAEAVRGHLQGISGSMIRPWRPADSGRSGSAAAPTAATAFGSAAPTAATVTAVGTATAPAFVFLADPFDDAPIEVQIERLSGDGTVLEGQYVRVGSARLDAEGVASPGKDGAADYRFVPNLDEDENCLNDPADCSRFDAPNVYYHVDRYAHEYWVGRLGVDIDFQADVRIHFPTGEGGLAHPETNRIYLSTGDIFTRNSALEDDMIYHEYNHLVAAALGFDVVAENTQAVALSEGMADYFSGSYTEDPRFGEWVVTCPPSFSCPRDRPNDTDLRTMDLDPAVWNWNFGDPSPDLRYGWCLRYHEGDGKCKGAYNNSNNAYVWSMIWSGAMWRLRGELGAEVTDALAVEAIRHFQPYVSFARAVNHLLDAAFLFPNPQEIRSDILGVFDESGIAPHIAPGVEADALPLGWSLDIWPNPASDAVRVRFDRPIHDAAGVTAELTLVDALGRRVLGHFVTPGSGAAELNVARLSPGVYGLRIVSGGHAVFRTITITR